MLLSSDVKHANLVLAEDAVRAAGKFEQERSFSAFRILLLFLMRLLDVEFAD